MSEAWETSKPGCSVVGFLVWFLGGISLSLSIIFSLILLVLLIASVFLNIYLGWQLSWLEITISRATPPPPQVVTASPTTEAVTLVVTGTPTVDIIASSTAEPADVQVEKQVGTVAAIATEALAADESQAFVPPVETDKVTEPVNSSDAASSRPESPAPPEAQAAALVTPVLSSGQVSRASVSSNIYQLIPIEGERESRPAKEHGDLNLKLRDPQPIEAELSVVDAGVGIDPDAPKLSKIFKPEFTAAYTVYDWDWGCNCKGKLIQEDSVVLVKLKTTPGEPVYIPPRQQDIYDKKYYAVVLYADEDSLTFLYNRAGSVVQGYTIHYVGLQTDPKLVALFQESQGKELPGLTLDTPVGVATDGLLIAIRDNGKFLDVRSKNDWWN
jgi:hypothetical protein